MWNDKIHVDGVYAIDLAVIGDPQFLEVERESDKIGVYNVPVAVNFYVNYGFRRGDKNGLIYRENQISISVNGEDPQPPIPPHPPIPVPLFVLGTYWDEYV
jgi:hypothetical protein